MTDKQIIISLAEKYNTNELLCIEDYYKRKYHLSFDMKFMEWFTGCPRERILKAYEKFKLL